jgi:hypothetical protein
MTLTRHGVKVTLSTSYDFTGMVTGTELKIVAAR